MDQRRPSSAWLSNGKRSYGSSDHSDDPCEVGSSCMTKLSLRFRQQGSLSADGWRV